MCQVNDNLANLQPQCPQIAWQIYIKFSMQQIFLFHIFLFSRRAIFCPQFFVAGLKYLHIAYLCVVDGRSWVFVYNFWLLVDCFRWKQMGRSLQDAYLRYDFRGGCRKKSNIFLLFQLIELSLCINFTYKVRATTDMEVN